MTQSADGGGQSWLESRRILKDEESVGFAVELATWCEGEELRMNSRVVGLSSRRRWSCLFRRGRQLQEQFVGWGGHPEWRFDRVTLEVSVRCPRGNSMGSGVFESGIQGKG